MNPPDFPPLGDDELLLSTRDAISLTDPPPPDLADRARRAFGWDAALAVLTEEVSATAAQPALRAGDMPTVIRYTLEAVRVEVEVEPGADESITVVGSVEPVPVRVRAVESSGRVAEVDVDDRGRFTLETRATAVVLQFELADGSRVRTPALELDSPPPS